MPDKPDAIKLIVGNSNSRFSGVTSTMLQVLGKQQAMTSLAVLGAHNLPADTPVLTFYQMLKTCRASTDGTKGPVFHARRNDEMIQALIAKHIFGAKIKIAFTSTAQRHHSNFTRWLMGQMDAIISTCNAAASYLTSRPADIIIPHGIDTERYVPPASRSAAWKALGLPGELGIGMFGRVRASKGVDILVDAAILVLPKHPQATVVICGECLPSDYAFKDRLLAKIKRAGMEQRFVFLGKRPFDELPGLFQSMSVAAALSRSEGFGLTPLEAMASGCAVLTSRAGAWPEIVENGVTGFCVETGNSEAVAEKLDLMLADSALLTKMGVAARQFVLEKHTIEREARVLTDFLLSLA